MKKILNTLSVALALCATLRIQSSSAQGLVLNTNQNQTSYFQNFDGIGTGLPVEWLVY